MQPLFKFGKPKRKLTSREPDLHIVFELKREEELPDDKPHIPVNKVLVNYIREQFQQMGM